MLFTRDHAAAFVRLPLQALRREYPNHLMHVMHGPADAGTPRVLHPVFYGCYDWHSAVHGYWLLARSMRVHPGLVQEAAVIVLFDEHFTSAAMAQELAYFQGPDRRAFERPYGWAWLMALAQELDVCPHPHASTWCATLAPLVTELRGRVLDYFATLSYPIRVGTHYNSAFALNLLLDFARHRQDATLTDAILATGKRFFLADTHYPVRYEPGGDEFLSPALMEAVLMADILSGPDFAHWFDQFLPDLAGTTRLMDPAHVSDRTDPKIAHLDGLNLSRVWCMRALAARLPPSDPACATLEQAAARHLSASLPHVASGSYAGEHWLATFAMLALQTPS